VPPIRSRPRPDPGREFLSLRSFVQERAAAVYYGIIRDEREGRKPHLAGHSGSAT
jgi:hypothetical protein